MKYFPLISPHYHALGRQAGFTEEVLSELVLEKPSLLGRGTERTGQEERMRHVHEMGQNFGHRAQEGERKPVTLQEASGCHSKQFRFYSPDNGTTPLRDGMACSDLMELWHS